LRRIGESMPPNGVNEPLLQVELNLFWV
jgi:hypothetical protein